MPYQRLALLSFLIFTFWVSPSQAAANLPKYTWNELVSETHAKQIFTAFYKAASESPEDFALQVEAAELSYYAWRVNTNNKERMEIAKLTHRLGKQMAKLQPARAEGYLWMGSALGMISLGRGVLNSLQLIPEVKGNLEKAEALDPAYFDGTPYAVQGRLYTVLPGFPVSIGSFVKAEELINKAQAVAPSNVLYMLYKADLLWAQGRVPEAIAEAERVLQTKPTNLVQRFNRAVSENKAKEIIARMKSGERRPPFHDVLADFEQKLVD